MAIVLLKHIFTEFSNTFNFVVGFIEFAKRLFLECCEISSNIDLGRLTINLFVQTGTNSKVSENARCTTLAPGYSRSDLDEDLTFGGDQRLLVEFSPSKLRGSSKYVIGLELRGHFANRVRTPA